MGPSSFRFPINGLRVNDMEVVCPGECVVQALLYHFLGLVRWSAGCKGERCSALQCKPTKITKHVYPHKYQMIGRSCKSCKTFCSKCQGSVSWSVLRLCGVLFGAMGSEVAWSEMSRRKPRERTTILGLEYFFNNFCHLNAELAGCQSCCPPNEALHPKLEAGHELLFPWRRRGFVAPKGAPHMCSSMEEAHRANHRDSADWKCTKKQQIDGYGMFGLGD